MAAGLGFKDFVTGEVLTAADVDGYLMQGVWVFASAAARDAAVTSPQEGNFAYLKDTNVTTYYTGSAWANLDTTGMTNPMTTTGDTIYSSSGSTPARLGIGSTGQVLTVAGGVPSWATASSGALTLINTYTPSAVSSQTMDNIFSSTYNNYYILFNCSSSASDSLYINYRVSGTDTTTNYSRQQIIASGTTMAAARVDSGAGAYEIGAVGASATSATTFTILGPNLATPTIAFTNSGQYASSNMNNYQYALYQTDATQFTGCKIFPGSGTITGTISVYGYSK